MKICVAKERHAMKCLTINCESNQSGNQWNSPKLSSNTK